MGTQKDRKFSTSEVQELFERLLIKAENNGYPFAAIRLDSIRFNQEEIYASIQVELNERISLEAIKVQGDLELKERYLHQVLGIKPGNPFSRQAILQAKDRLQNIAFVNSTKDPTVDFLGSAATLNLYLDSKNANRFDILLGLLPSPDENKRFQLTGNVEIDMSNQFGSGERFHLNYENLMPGTQRLELALEYPFLFDLPFGADVDFNLYKRDSSYLDLGYQLGIQYVLRHDNYITFFVENQSTNLLTIDTLRIKQTKKLPPAIDISQNLFGVEYHIEKLNYRLNPRKGHQLTIRASAGIKKIKKNNTIISLTDNSDPDFDYNDLYLDLDLNSFQYKVSGRIEKYLSVFNNSTIKLANVSGLVGSGQNLYNNELFRTGGSKILRGFNEEAILASFYSVFTTEFRLLFNQNSNLFVFSDLGFYQQNTSQTKIQDYPIGIGTGLNLETDVGVFAISYAIGREKNLPFSFKTGKIHFGMVSRF